MNKNIRRRQLAEDFVKKQLAQAKSRFSRLRTRRVCRNTLSGIARFRLGSAALFTKISLRCDFP
ncbi:MAG TPA: hypothetical protein H9731_05210 [Candidatus Borkfalkia excrementipullorum]|nr:hypothetical protein [Candidatus Borkfalkia excrementipullorum]